MQLFSYHVAVRRGTDVDQPRNLAKSVTVEQMNRESMSEILTARAEQIISSLNDVQKRAVLHREGPLVVFAGAGSGKTRIITSRISYLIETGIRPSQILAVTFY